MRPSITRRDLETRIDRLLDELNTRQANLGVTSGRHAIDEAADALESRGIVVRGAAGSVFAIAPSCAITHDRHLLAALPSPTDARQRRRGSSTFSRSSAVQDARVAVGYGSRQPRAGSSPARPPGSHRRRARGGGTRPAHHDGPSRRASAPSHAPTPPRGCFEVCDRSSQRHRPEHLTQAHAAQADKPTARRASTTSTRARASGTCRSSSDRRGSSAHRGDAQDFRNAVGPRPPSDGRRAASGPLSTEGSAAVSGWARGSGSEKGAYKEPKTVAYQNKPDIDAAYARL